jgi:transposase-like protein
VSQSNASKAEAAEERTEQTRSFVRRVRAATRRRYTPEEKIRIVLEGFRREITVNDLCRREGIKPHSYYA